MSFKLDEQTKKDLNVFPSSGDKSLYAFFNLCRTQGGKAILTKMMSEPSNDLQFLKKRQNIIAFIQSNIDFVTQLDIDKNCIDFIEHYLRHFDYPTRKPSKYRVLEKALTRKIKDDSDYYIIERGIDYIYTTINLNDNIGLSYSHFYSEVRRAKEIVQKLDRELNMLIIFDELFRGTNVKDAYEGSLAIISALAHTNNSFYIVSTHILEVADGLKNKNIQYLYLETLNKNDTPKYTYKVKSGISKDRLGMYIIEKEKIIETINKTFEKNETI